MICLQKGGGKSQTESITWYQKYLREFFICLVSSGIQTEWTSIANVIKVFTFMVLKKQI